MSDGGDLTTYRHELPGGRELAYAVVGLPLNSHEEPDAVLVYHHGWPSCRYEAVPLHDAALSLKLRILSLDRPGIGETSWDPEGTFESWAKDVASLLDALGVPTAVAVGTSGGGPYAMALARYLPPGRVAALALIASMTATLGSPEAAAITAKMDWVDRAAAALVASPAALKAALVAAWPAFAAAPALSALQLLPDSVTGPLGMLATSVGFAAPDRRLVADNPRLMWTLLPQMLSQSMCQGTQGLHRDMTLTSNPWSFELSDVKAPAALVFWGDQDASVPREMADALARGVPGAKLRVFEGEGHLSLLVNKGGDILADIAAAVRGGGGGGK